MTASHHWNRAEPADPAPPSEYLAHADWRISDAVLAYLVGILGIVLTTAAVMLVGLDIDVGVSIVVAQLALVGFTFWFLRRRSRKRGTGSLAADTGLVLRWRDWWAVPLALLLQVVIGLVSTLAAFLLLGEEAPMQEIGEVVAVSPTILDAVALGIVAVVLAPLLEEVLFRGVLLRGLLRRFGPRLAIALSAAGFSLTHLEALEVDQLPILLDTFLWGLVLAWFTLRRGDLSFALLLHGASNLLAVVALLAI